MDGHVGDLTLGTGGRLVDHDLGVGQRNALALGACGQQESTHAGAQAHADGGHIALDILHGIIDSHAGSDAAAGAVDVHLDVLVGILSLQVQQLGNHQRGGGIIDLFAQEDDAVIQQSGENIVGTLTPIGLLHNIRD